MIVTLIAVLCSSQVGVTPVVQTVPNVQPVVHHFLPLPAPQQRVTKFGRGWVFQRHNPNYFGSRAVGSGNRIVNIFGRQNIQIDVFQNAGWQDFDNDGVLEARKTQTISEDQPKRRRRLFRR